MREEKGYAAKATALFIRKYGKERYGEILNRAIQQGVQYAGDLDAMESGSIILSTVRSSKSTKIILRQSLVAVMPHKVII